MLIRSSFQRRGLRVALACAGISWVMAASVVAVHAEDDEDVLNPGWSDRIGKQVKDKIDNAGKMVGLGKPTPPPPPESPSGCPTIGILDGTQSQRVMAAGGTDNQGVRYQFSLFNVGRECSMAGGRIALKIGADGRVLLGPAGAPGHFDIPIRVVVYSDLSQKPIESKLYRVSANVPAGQSGTPFQFVSDSLVVPMTNGRNGTDYSIKVGFDGKGTDAARPAKVARHKRKPVESAAAQ